MTFNRFAGLGTLHALRTLVFRSRTAWLRRFQGRERDVRDDSASVCLGGAGRQGIEAVLRLATDELCVDVRAPSRSAVFPIRPTRQCRGKSLYKTQPEIGSAGYRGRPPFGDRRIVRGCSGAVPERRVPHTANTSVPWKESLQDTTRDRVGRVSRPSSVWRPTNCAWMFGRRPGAPCSPYGQHVSAVERVFTRHNP